MNTLLFGILEKLRERPILYIGEKSVVGLHLFLCGYFVAYRETIKTFIGRELHDFTDWLANRYSRSSVVGFRGLLLEKTNGDDEAAFDLFWQEWDEFCKENLNEQNENQSVHE